MAIFTCACGNRISLNQHPSGNLFVVFTQDQVDGLIDKIIEVSKSRGGLEPFGLTIAKLLRDDPRRPTFVECATCRRLSFTNSAESFKEYPLVYALERKVDANINSVLDLFSKL